MSLSTAGQRCLSEREPELGLGVVAQVDRAAKRIAVDFPAPFGPRNPWTCPRCTSRSSPSKARVRP